MAERISESGEEDDFDWKKREKGSTVLGSLYRPDIGLISTFAPSGYFREITILF